MRDDASTIAEAAAVLRRGGLVALPTETVYGLGADATNEAAVRRIFAAKGRPADHPLIVHLADASELATWAREVPPEAHALARRFWPGPLTLVLRRAPHVLDAVTGGQDTVALRVPETPITRAILERLGRGVAAPSANRFGRVSPTTAEAVRLELGDDVDLVVDGGPCRVGVESTIVDLTGEPTLLRPGGVPAEAIEAALGRPLRRGGSAVRAPGTLAAHYAPRARVVLCEADEVARAASAHLASGDRVGLLATTALPVPEGLVDLRVEPTPEAAAHALYARLREADALGIDVLLAVPPSPTGLGEAVVDRLLRAAAAHARG